MGGLHFHGFTDWIARKTEVRDAGYVSPCWLWLGQLTPKGYAKDRVPKSTGVIVAGGRSRNHRIHRVTYTQSVGPIPQGLVLDHLCRNRACVNPAHVEPVTIAENNRRGIPCRDGNRTHVNWYSKRTHCGRGHEYNEIDTHIAPDGHRICRICKRDYMREYMRGRHKTKLAA